MLALISLLLIAIMIHSAYSGQQEKELRLKMIKELEKEGYKLSDKKMKKN